MRRYHGIRQSEQVSSTSRRTKRGYHNGPTLRTILAEGRSPPDKTLERRQPIPIITRKNPTHLPRYPSGLGLSSQHISSISSYGHPCSPASNDPIPNSKHSTHTAHIRRRQEECFGDFLTNSRERFLATLDRGNPVRVPYCEAEKCAPEVVRGAICRGMEQTPLLQAPSQNSCFCTPD